MSDNKDNNVKVTSSFKLGYWSFDFSEASDSSLNKFPFSRIECTTLRQVLKIPFLIRYILVRTITSKHKDFEKCHLVEPHATMKLKSVVGTL